VGPQITEGVYGSNPSLVHNSNSGKPGGGAPGGVTAEQRLNN